MAENYYVLEQTATGLRMVSSPPNKPATPKAGDHFGLRDPGGNIYEYGYFSDAVSPTSFTAVTGYTDYTAARLAGNGYRQYEENEG